MHRARTTGGGDNPTIGSVKRSSCIKASPVRGEPLCIALKKFRMNVRAALGSELGRKGRRRKGISRAETNTASQSNFSWLDSSAIQTNLWISTPACILSKVPALPLRKPRSAAMHPSTGASWERRWPLVLLAFSQRSLYSRTLVKKRASFPLATLPPIYSSLLLLLPFQSRWDD